MSRRIGIIGGTGLSRLQGLRLTEEISGDTRFGSPSSSVRKGLLGEQQVLFLARHGDPHCIPPHLSLIHI